MLAVERPFAIRLIRLDSYLEVEDDYPNQPENNLWAAINDINWINIHQFDLKGLSC